MICCSTTNARRWWWRTEWRRKRWKGNFRWKPRNIGLLSRLACNLFHISLSLIHCHAQSFKFHPLQHLKVVKILMFNVNWKLIDECRIFMSCFRFSAGGEVSWSGDSSVLTNQKVKLGGRRALPKTSEPQKHQNINKANNYEM